MRLVPELAVSLAISLSFSSAVLAFPSVIALTHAPVVAFEQQRYLRTELYFGRSIPGGGGVSTEQWEKFLAEVVTPRFPDGFTIVPATGQYRGNDRSIIKEQSEILIFFYPASRRVSSSRKIEEIRRTYKRQFMQESVLRVDLADRVRVSF